MAEKKSSPNVGLFCLFMLLLTTGMYWLSEMTGLSPVRLLAVTTALGMIE